jgi:hypothetical protein
MPHRLVAYNGFNNTFRGYMPHPLEWSLTCTFNELSVLTIHYDRFQTAESVHLDSAYTEIAVELLTQSGAWEEIHGSRCALQTVEYDHLEDVPTRRYDLLGIGEATMGALVYAANGLPVNAEGKVQFVNRTPGYIIKTVWDNAVTRGCLTGYTLSNGTNLATQDASSNAWPTSINLSFDPDVSLYAIINQLIQLGLIDFRWEGKTLKVWKPGILTTNVSPGTKFYNSSFLVDSAPETIDKSQRASHVFVVGEGGLSTGNTWTYATGGTTLAEGRRERAVRYDNVNSSTVAAILAAPLQVRGANDLTNTTRQFQLNSPLAPSTAMEPFKSFQCGNFIDVQRSDWGSVPGNRDWTWVNMKVISINLLVNQNGTQGYVVFGDKVDTLLGKLYAKVQQLVQAIASN